MMLKRFVSLFRVYYYLRTPSSRKWRIIYNIIIVDVFYNTKWLYYLFLKIFFNNNIIINFCCRAVFRSFRLPPPPAGIMHEEHAWCMRNMASVYAEQQAASVHCARKMTRMIRVRSLLSSSCGGSLDSSQVWHAVPWALSAAQRLNLLFITRRQLIS